jgi:hypothetical protein
MHAPEGGATTLGEHRPLDVTRGGGAMLGRRRFGAGLVLAATASLSAGCGSTTDPFTTGPARATVTGAVTASAGTPIVETTISIDCAGGGPLVHASTDSTGHYLANLATSSDPFDGESGKLLCHFSEPADAVPRAQIDTALGFVRGPVLVALQFVDLHEP